MAAERRRIQNKVVGHICLSLTLCSASSEAEGTSLEPGGGARRARHFARAHFDLHLLVEVPVHEGLQNVTHILLSRARAPTASPRKCTVPHIP